MKLILKLRKVLFLDIKQAIGSSTGSLNINDDLCFIYDFGVDIKFIPNVLVPSISPVMATHSVTSMDENVHQMIVLFAALN